jgi:hypothetical protein
VASARILLPECPGSGVSSATLLLTSLRPRSPFVLFNVSLGDRAVLAPRGCGCALADLGWTTHLHTIWSDEKLTAGGMNFFDGDLVHVLEDVLPARVRLRTGAMEGAVR